MPPSTAWHTQKVTVRLSNDLYTRVLRHIAGHYGETTRNISTLMRDALEHYLASGKRPTKKRTATATDKRPTRKEPQ